MALQTVPEPSAHPSDAQAIVAVRGAEELTQEEYEKRVKDAEVLEEKLRFITEKIPTRIMNTAGSNAGAGSGEFHMYRMARRREQMRQQRIERDAEEEALEEERQKRKIELAEQDAERTAKRRAKRQKKKEKGHTDKGATGQQVAAEAAAQRRDASRAGPEPADLD